MMSNLQDHYEVPVITLALDLTTRRPRVDIEDPLIRVRLELGTELRYEVSIGASELRLPPTLAAVAANTGVGKLEMPGRVIDGLAAGLCDWPDDLPVWLRLGSPTGHLSVVPWEHVLQRRLGVRMLRMPEVTLPAAPTGGTLEIVVCASAPQPGAPYALSACLSRVLSELRDVRPGRTRVQVFTDDATERDRLRRSYPEVVVHEPPSGDRGCSPRSDLLQNAWLRWMACAVGEETCVDIVHFVCPGQLSATFGSLKLDAPVFTAPPTAWTQVHATELVTFLTSVGAAAAAFTIPSSRARPAGIRALAHSAIRDLTGPVLVDAPYHDRRRPEMLGAIYRMLFGPAGSAVPRTPGVATYVHPQRVERAADVRSDRTRAFEAKTAAVTAELTLAPFDVVEPALCREPSRGMGANQRLLEQIATEIVDPIVDSDHRAASDQGVREALGFLKDVLGKDVEQLPQDVEEGVI